MSSPLQMPPSGWYPDPAGSGDERYWDGGTWSQVTRPVGGVYAQPVPPQQVAPQARAPQYQQRYPQYQGPEPYTAMARQPRIAGWWWRVLAAIIDSVILMVPLSLLQNLLFQGTILELNAWAERYLNATLTGGTDLPAITTGMIRDFLLYTLFTMAVWIVYRTLMVARFGGTLGQLACAMRVIIDGDQQMSIVSMRTSAVRATLAMVFQQIPVFNLVNVLAPLFNKKVQTFHDMLAHTVVIKK